jgi:HEAT repeat protein
MRRVPPAAGLFVALLGLAGCGQKTETVANTDPPPPPPAVTPAPAKPAAATPDPVPPGEPTPSEAPGRIPPFVPYGPLTPPAGLPVAPPPAAPGASVPPPPRDPEAAFPPPGEKKVPPGEKPADKKPPEPKEKLEGSVKTIEWPTEIYGKKLSDFIKDTTDLDPAVRELALRTIPGFGPTVRKEQGAARAIITRMDASKERDPGVRAAAYETAGLVGFDDSKDIAEAVRLLFVAADQGAPGGGTRLHAVQTLASFGPKAEGAVTYLVGPPATDPAYETRRSVANTLGRIGMNETNGPNQKALGCLVNMINDHSAPVRLEAMQSLILLGPPWQAPVKGAPVAKGTPAAKQPPKIDKKVVDGYVAVIKKRLAPCKKTEPTPTGLIEPDKQVEIYARLVLIRFEPEEFNEENLNGIAKYITGTETGPKLHALTVFGMLGEPGAKKIDEVVKALTDDNPQVVQTAVSALVSMGVAGQGAIPFLEKLKDRPLKLTDPKDREKEKEYWTKLSDEAVKYLKEAKPRTAVPPPDAKP